MLEKVYPRDHARFSSLPLFGPLVEDFVVWLTERGYPRLPVRLRVRTLPRIDALLSERGVRRLEGLDERVLRGLRPAHSRDDIYLTATVRSLVAFLDARGLLAHGPVSPAQQLVGAYSRYLERVRGFAVSTRTHHAATVSELLDVLGYDADPAVLNALDASAIEAFVRRLAGRWSRHSLAHGVSQLRSFLRYLAARGIVRHGLDTEVDTPRVYREERLPRTLPWATVRALLGSIDRSTPMGRRDFAMLLLVATYGLRSSEVVALRLHDVRWRERCLHVRRPKAAAPLELPLTDAVAAALVDHIRHGRPDLAYREVFLRVRAPSGVLRPTALTEAFQGAVRRAGLDIPFQGPHCLRHSLAVHLLRRGTGLTTIGELLGHRGVESTAVYLRLHVEDLRAVALPLPAGGVR